MRKRTCLNPFVGRGNTPALQVAAEYERVVVFRLGRLLGGTKGPGIFFILPCLDNIIRVDLRTVSCDVPTQEVGAENMNLAEWGAIGS